MTRTPSLLRAAAFVILFLGLALAARIDSSARRAAAAAAAQPADILASAPLSPADSKRDGYQVGQLAGNTGLLAYRATLIFQGRPFAILLALISFAAAALLLRAADRAA